MAEARTVKTAGIIGGMGPEATIDLMRRIVAHTKAGDDADHVHCLVDQNPKIPSRIKVLLEGGDVSPGPCMAGMAKRLEEGGADFLCIPCNTAHNWYGEVAASVQVPVLNIIEIASEAASEKLGGLQSVRSKVGILASPAVRLTHLYEEPCSKNGLVPLYADKDMENQLLEIIKRVKAGDAGAKTQEMYAEVVRHMEKRGAQALIVACTELGILDINTSLPVVDAADALAVAIVREAGAELV